VATYGNPNMVGYAQTPPPAPIKPYIAPVAAGAVGARMLYTGARPNVAGRIKAADSRVDDLDRKLANEAKYKTPRKANVESLQRQRVHAVRAQGIIRAKAPLRATKKIRGIRAGAGAGLVGLAALTMPRRPKPVLAPPVPVLAAKSEQPRRGRLRRRRTFRRGGGPSLIDWVGDKTQATIDRRIDRAGLSVAQHQQSQAGDWSQMEAQATSAMARSKAKAGKR
jgi:hypothetical protein